MNLWSSFNSLIGCDNHFSVTMYFCQIGRQFSCLLGKGVYYSAISINFITELLNCDRSHRWHRIKLDSHLLNSEDHVSFGRQGSWLTTARGSDLWVQKHCIIQSVWQSDLRSHLLKSHVFLKEQRTYDEQPHSSPMEILNVFKILLLKQYLPWSKWLRELQRKKKLLPWLCQLLMLAAPYSCGKQ